MKKLVFILAVISCFSCKKDAIKGVIMDRSITFSVYNSQNENLLDSVTFNHYEASEIKLFYEVDGEIEEIIRPRMAYPRNFMLFKHENENRIQITLNDSEISDKSITYIQWNNSDTDTVEALFERINLSVFKSKVWLNGQEIWDKTIDDPAYYKICKNMP